MSDYPVPAYTQVMDMFEKEHGGPNPYYKCKQCGKTEPGTSDYLHAHWRKHQQGANMSEHNKPQSGYLIDALRMHHLPSDKPSQLADAFRDGFNHQQSRIDALEAQHQVMLDTLGDEMEKGFVLKSECKQFAAQAAENLLRANQMTEQHRMQCEMRKRLEAENEKLRINDARWRTFISLSYEIRAEWARNLSLAPVLTQWVDSAAMEETNDN